MDFTCDACGQASHVCGCFSHISKKQRVLNALESYPGMSDVAIAEICGVSDSTVLRTRRSTSSHEEVDETVEVKRVGKDGKERRMPTKPEPKEEPKPTQALHLQAAFAYADVGIGAARELQSIVTNDLKNAKPLVDAVKKIIDAWTEILNKIGK